MAPRSSVHRRACDYVDSNGYCTDWWWSDTGLAVRYVVVVVFLAVVVGFILGSYMHAQRRIRKNLPPLAYHRWLVSRRHRQFQNGPSGLPSHGHAVYHSGPEYNMQPPSQQPHHGPVGGLGYYGQAAPAPPAYNQWDAPPQYQPPPGGSKLAPNQNLAGNTLEQQHQGQSSQQGGVQMQPPQTAYAPPQSGH